MPQPRKSTAQKAPPRNPNNALDNEFGNFYPNGGWDPKAVRGQAGRKVYDCVRALVSSRQRHPELLPSELAEVISRNGLEAAFPNQAQWAQCDNWLGARCSTAAERTVATACGLRIPDPVGVVPPVDAAVAALLESITGTSVPRLA